MATFTVRIDAPATWYVEIEAEDEDLVVEVLALAITSF